METISFDLKKSLADLAQFDAATANSANTLDANFTTQLTALSTAFQTTADTFAASVTIHGSGKMRALKALIY